MSLSGRNPQTASSAARASIPSVGIIGGGQLGRMLIYRAKKLGMRVAVLDRSADAPAAALADRFVSGDLYDADAIRILAEGCDVVTCEIEHLSSQTLSELEDSGVAVHPSAAVLSTIQDKYAQKLKLSQAGVPVPRFARLDEGSSVHHFGLPCVQKLRTGGYDGRGVAVLRGEKDLHGMLAGETMLEELVAIEKELAVIVARGRDGTSATFPVVEMRFREGANILDRLEAPAGIDRSTADRAVEVSEAAAAALGGFGVYAVELFLTPDGRILVNEIAPRPHNSGHYTIEACVTDQFEQHLRAICGLPVGSTRQLSPAVTINLLGASGSRGNPTVHGLEAALSLPGVSFHWYGKSETRPNRKMGHVTVLAESMAEARETAHRVADTIRITGDEEDGESEGG